MSCTRALTLGILALLSSLAACEGRVAPGPAPGFVTPAEAAAPAEAPAPAVVPVPQRAADGSFPERLSWAGRALLRNGTALCEWGIFGIDLYVAALYCERPVRSLAEALDPEQVVVVHLHFVRGLSAEQLGEAFTASCKVNAGERLAGFESALHRLCAAMRPVRNGGTLTFGCEPGQGVTVVHGGALVDRIEDEAFRRLFVQMYLGDHPPTAAVRDGLLGK